MSASTYTIQEIAMHLVKVGRAKDATVAGKRVRSALRANKPAMAKVDANVKRHQKGATYVALNASSTKVLCDALNVKVTDIRKPKRSRKPKVTNVTNVTTNVTPDEVTSN